jgi:hypothetical protein
MKQLRSAVVPYAILNLKIKYALKKGLPFDSVKNMDKNVKN